jgi:putative ABC transport system ATP-binding protein
MLEAVGLHEHARHRPDALSGGQRQRVAIARALVKRPTLVIADEPTASLDSHTADQVLDLMREQGHAHGAAFLIATHDARLLRRCDRAIALLDGQIQPAQGLSSQGNEGPLPSFLSPSGGGRRKSSAWGRS